MALRVLARSKFLLHFSFNIFSLKTTRHIAVGVNDFRASLLLKRN